MNFVAKRKTENEYMYKVSNKEHYLVFLTLFLILLGTLPHRQYLVICLN